MSCDKRLEMEQLLALIMIILKYQTNFILFEISWIYELSNSIIYDFGLGWSNLTNSSRIPIALSIGIYFKILIMIYY